MQDKYREKHRKVLVIVFDHNLNLNYFNKCIKQHQQRRNNNAENFRDSGERERERQRETERETERGKEGEREKQKERDTLRNKELKPFLKKQN